MGTLHNCDALGRRKAYRRVSWRCQAAVSPSRAATAVAGGDGLAATLDRLPVAWLWLGMRLKPLQGMFSLAVQPWRQKSRLCLWLLTQM